MRSKLLRNQQGTSLVEFVIILPVLMLITLAVIDLGRAYATDLFLMSSAREGAYYLMQNPRDTAGAIEQTTDALTEYGVPIEEVTITATSAGSGDMVTVSVSYDFPLLFGFLPFSTVPLDITVSMPAI